MYLRKLKAIFLKVVLFVLLFGRGNLLFSQQKGSSAKFDPPVVKTYLGIGTDTVNVEKDKAVQLIGLPLTVKDSKGTPYKLRYYQFVYKRKDSFENLKTGKPEVVYNTVGQSFYETPLPKVWVDNIIRQLKPGEELFFFDVLAEDKTNRTFYAPNLKIIVK